MKGQGFISLLEAALNADLKQILYFYLKNFSAWN